MDSPTGRLKSNQLTGGKMPRELGYMTFSELVPNALELLSNPKYWEAREAANRAYQKALDDFYATEHPEISDDEYYVMASNRAHDAEQKEFDRVMGVTPMKRVWEQYEEKNGPVSDNAKALAECALSLELEK